MLAGFTVVGWRATGMMLNGVQKPLLKYNNIIAFCFYLCSSYLSVNIYKNCKYLFKDMLCSMNGFVLKFLIPIVIEHHLQTIVNMSYFFPRESLIDSLIEPIL